jgi:hypothetical protein
MVDIPNTYALTAQSEGTALLHAGSQKGDPRGGQGTPNGAIAIAWSTPRSTTRSPIMACADNVLLLRTHFECGGIHGCVLLRKQLLIPVA